MRLRRLLVPVLVLASSAVAAPRPGGAAAAPTADLSALPRPLAATLVRMAKDTSPQLGAWMAERTGVPLPDPLRNTDPWIAIPGPDLTGDGEPEIYDLRYSRDHAPEFDLVVRDGPDGHRLWRHQSDRTASIPFFVTVDKHEAPGVGLLEVDIVAETTWNWYYSAFDATGRRLFEASPGARGIAGQEILKAEPWLRGHLRGGPGAESLLLFDVTTGLPTVAINGVGSGVYTYETHAMSMADGSMVRLGETLSLTGFRPSSAAVGDVDGDGLDDYAVLHKGQALDRGVPGSDGVVRLHRRDGSLHTRTPHVPVGQSGYAVDAGDLNQDGQHEVLVMSGGNESGYGIYISGGIPDDIPRNVSLIDPAEGELRWSRRGWFGTSVERVDPGKIHDVAVIDTPRESGRVEVRITIMTTTAEVLRDQVAVSVPPGDSSTSFVTLPGDVQPDGALDLVVGARSYRGRDEIARDEVLLDGRSGRRLRNDPGWPLFGSVGAPGADLIRSEYDADTKSGETVIEDGATGRPVARMRFASPTKGFAELVPYRPESGPRCAALLLPTRITTDDWSDAALYEVDSTEPTWTLRRNDRGDQFGGAVPELEAFEDLCPAASGAGSRPVPARPQPHPRPAPEPLPATGGSLPGGAALALLGAGAATVLHRRRPWVMESAVTG
jgi:hypothetical protein